ncbi:MAG: DUF1295 domain-containing protein [bacterium]|nr:MAG: DUF1295 domain-containing protein [bacterium]
MFFINEYNKSLTKKFLIMITFIVVIVVYTWLMFVDGNDSQIKGDFIRRMILVSCSIIYLLRVGIMAFIFLRRKLVWPEVVTIAIVMPIIIFALLYAGGKQSQSVNSIDIIGILLYLFGSYLNTQSEYLRHIWKQKQENKGRLYTKGLFKYSMHINYFGDIVLFSGWAMITQNAIMLLIPLLMALNFMFFIIPSLDEYLEKKYGKEFQEYAKQTKRFIPLVY